MRPFSCFVLVLGIGSAWAAAPREAELPLPLSAGSGSAPAGPEDELTPAQRDAIWREIDAAREKLFLPKVGSRPAFIWPLRAARGFSQPGVDRIANYVDHDPAFPSKLRDYNCGARTYDRDTGYNHRGIDISIWPDSWNMMQTGQLEIVAAAAGTIVSKSDGNFDRNCSFNSSNWNAVYVQHDDGSIAWYGHMKSGSLTPKPVGARVLAGEFLGNIGSSGNSTGPHLHFEVYDADKRLIDPFKGACNTLNADSWWAQQPAYAITRLNRLITASAPPVFATCGSDGRVQSTGSIHEKSDFAPGQTAYFTAFVRDAQPGQAVSFRILQPDGTVWGSHVTPPRTTFGSAAYWFVSYALPQGPQGTWTVEAEVGGSQSVAPFTLTAAGAGIENYTDLWWNPAEPGWGININHQGEIFFATWFTYDADGAPMWLVMPEAAGNGATKSGTIYRATGLPFWQVSGAPAANFPLPAVGHGSFEPAAGGALRFSYTVEGISQSKTIQRQGFAGKTRCVETRGSRIHATNYQDLWWNAAEPGWGLNVAHQDETVFATWFTFGPAGRDQWLVASEMRRQPTGEFRGPLYRTAGRVFHQIEGASALAGPPVATGEATLTFSDGERGRLDYVVEGIAQSKPITRQVFGATAPLCR